MSEVRGPKQIHSQSGAGRHRAQLPCWSAQPTVCREIRSRWGAVSRVSRGWTGSSLGPQAETCPKATGEQRGGSSRSFSFPCSYKSFSKHWLNIPVPSWALNHCVNPEITVTTQQAAHRKADIWDISATNYIKEVKAGFPREVAFAFPEEAEEEKRRRGSRRSSPDT